MSNRLKVLHVAPSYARSDGGPSEVLRQLPRALDSIGCTVRLLVTDKGAEGETYPWHNIRIAVARRPYRWSYSPGIRAMLREEVNSADIVHVHSVHTYPSTVAMAECRRQGVPYLLEPHGALDRYHIKQGRLKKSLYNRVFDHKNLANASGFIVSSRKEGVEAGEVVGLDRNIAVIPLGVDPSLFSLSRLAPDPRRSDLVQLLFLGRITAKKRLDVLLKALTCYPLNKIGLELVVAGPADRSLSFSPAEIVAKLGLCGNVRIIGPVDNLRRAELLQNADLFVLPSEDESFGVAAAEAMAAGCPVAVTMNVGLAEEAALSGAVFVISSDPQILSTQLAGLVIDYERRLTLATKAKAFAAAHFEWSAVALQLKKVYDAILGRSSR